MERITSVQNPKVKQWTKLHNRKEREKTGLFLVEGPHLVQEAFHCGRVESLILEEEKDIPFWMESLSQHIPKFIVTSTVMKKIGETETPQGIAAVVRMENEPFIPSQGSLLLLLDCVQDPGNLGTLIRTADAAGFDGVAIGKGSADPYNGKSLRSSMGSIFHLPVVQINAVEYLQNLRYKIPEVRIIGTSLQESQPYDGVSYEGSTVIVIGNEGSGVSPEVLNLADQNVIIPIYGKAESLNAAIAGSIIMYEAARQRQ